jgi:hypothetical protein
LWETVFQKIENCKKHANVKVLFKQDYCVDGIFGIGER